MPAQSKPTSKLTRIEVPKPNALGQINLSFRVKPPQVSAYGRSYVLAHLVGESAWTLDVGGKERTFRLQVLLYARIPPNQRYSQAVQQAQERLRAKRPQLF